MMATARLSRAAFVLFVFVSLTAMRDGFAESPAKTFDIRIENGRVAAKFRRIKVLEGDRVILKWSGSVAMTVHLEGYDLVTEVGPDAPGVIEFVAKTTGRYPVHAHEHRDGKSGGHAHGHGTLMHIEVHPR